jgi:hypothetical protein
LALIFWAMLIDCGDTTVTVKLGLGDGLVGAGFCANASGDSSSPHKRLRAIKFWSFVEFTVFFQAISKFSLPQ